MPQVRSPSAASARTIATRTGSLNAAMTANPIGLVVLAIVALVAVIVLLWVKCEGFRKVVLAVWNALQVGAVAAFNAIKTVVVTVWNAIRSATIAVWNGIRAALATAWAAVTRVFDFTLLGLVIKNFDKIKAVALSVAGAIRGAWDAVWSFISGIISKITGAWSKVSGILSHIPGLGGLASGKSITPTVASYTMAYPASVLMGGRAAGTQVRGQASSTVNVFGALDPEGVARQVRAILNASDIRHGRTTSLRRAVAW